MWWCHLTQWNSDIHQDQAETSHIQFFKTNRSLGHAELVMYWRPVLQISHTLHENGYKFLVSTNNLGFRILVFYHRVQWRGAKTAGKDCWGPCHGLIPSLRDFAQNYSLQIELNWRGAFYSLDSEKAIEPCISAVTDCLSWSTLDSVIALLEICPVCQLSRPLFQPRTP